jgi:hypothetical protein
MQLAPLHVGRRSRGSSLRGAANYPGSNKNLSRLGSTGNLQRCGSNASLNNAVARVSVSCALDAGSGDVVGAVQVEDSCP